MARKSERDLRREKEEEEEVKERKKLDRKAREKEAAYQVNVCFAVLCTPLFSLRWS